MNKYTETVLSILWFREVYKNKINLHHPGSDNFISPSITEAGRLLLSQG
jgi:hypothetical protein